MAKAQFKRTGYFLAADMYLPDTSIDNAIVRFDGTKANSLLSSNVLIDDDGDMTANSITLNGATSRQDLNITSNFSGGYNASDSTSRITLHSHQRAQLNNDTASNIGEAHYGEVLRIDIEEQQAKGAIAIRENYLGAGYPRTVAWMVAHGEANDSTPQVPSWHNHFSIELPDETGALQTSLEFPFAPFNTPNAFGMPTPDRYVRSVVGFCAAADIFVEQDPGIAKNVFFSSLKYKNIAGKRWGLQSDQTAETGSAVGSDFRLNSYDDTGAYTRTPIFVKRSNGYVGFQTTAPTRMLDINSDSIRLRTAKTPTTSATTGDAGQIAWDASYIYVCVATNTWKRSAITTW
jgi:hypothetical protein